MGLSCLMRFKISLLKELGVNMIAVIYKHLAPTEPVTALSAYCLLPTAYCFLPSAFCFGAQGLSSPQFSSVQLVSENSFCRLR